MEMSSLFSVFLYPGIHPYILQVISRPAINAPHPANNAPQPAINTLHPTINGPLPPQTTPRTPHVRKLCVTTLLGTEASFSFHLLS